MALVRPRNQALQPLYFYPSLKTTQSPNSDKHLQYFFLSRYLTTAFPSFALKGQLVEPGGGWRGGRRTTGRTRRSRLFVQFLDVKQRLSVSYREITLTVCHIWKWIVAIPELFPPEKLTSPFDYNNKQRHVLNFFFRSFIPLPSSLPNRSHCNEEGSKEETRGGERERGQRCKGNKRARVDIMSSCVVKRPTDVVSTFHHSDKAPNNAFFLLPLLMFQRERERERKKRRPTRDRDWTADWHSKHLLQGLLKTPTSSSKVRFLSSLFHVTHFHSYPKSNYCRHNPGK